MNYEPVHLLAISPHPSDPDFGIGGTAARWTRQGKSVVYVIATNGDKGSSDPDLLPEVLAKTREQEQIAAAKLIGVKDVIFLRHPDLGLEDEPSLRKEILRLILTYRECRKSIFLSQFLPLSKRNQDGFRLKNPLRSPLFLARTGLFRHSHTVRKW